MRAEVTPVDAVHQRGDAGVVDREDDVRLDAANEVDRLGDLCPRGREGSGENVDTLGSVGVRIAWVEQGRFAGGGDENAGVGDPGNHRKDLGVRRTDPGDGDRAELGDVPVRVCGESLDHRSRLGIAQPDRARVPVEQR